MHRSRLFLICLLPVWLLTAVVPARAGTLNRAGPAFSDPDFRVKMPEQWINHPIDRHINTRENGRERADLKVILDQQLYRILGPIIADFAKRNQLDIALSDGTCGHSAGALLKKRADIGAFCCPPRITDRLPGLRYHTLGITAIALLVHPDNPLVGLTTEEARAIFSGEIYRWKQLSRPGTTSLPDTPIVPVTRLHCKPRPGHWRLILDDEDDFSAELREVGAIPDMISVVATSPNAIGHAAYWLAKEHYRAKGRAKPLKVNGATPADIDTLVDGTYPFYKTFSITVWEGPAVENPQARKLVDHLLERIEHLPARYGIASPAALKRAGWIFKDGELVGEPP